MPSPFLGFINPVVETLVKLGVFRFLIRLNSESLTVLNYHRINDPDHAGFDTFKPNVSATPAEFARQMAYIKKNYNVVTCRDLESYLRGESPLPPRAAMVTFDDGYDDNFSRAFPVLVEQNVPAIIFLSTGFMEKSIPFYWDYVAYCFNKTNKTRAILPLLGDCVWNNEASKSRVMMRWIEEVKKIPESEKIELTKQIGDVLEVIPASDAFKNLYLSWDRIREMDESGLIEFGSHTVTHPILTRISPAEAQYEVEESRKRIEMEIKKPVMSLAYPNGGMADFSPEVIDAAKKAGIQIAFTLIPGASSYREVKASPFEIRRIYISRKDTFARFILKLSGLTRI